MGRDHFGAHTLTSSQLWGATFSSLAFLVGFRTNKAYQRFWDGTTLLNQMWGEWFDAASCLFAFSHLAREEKAAGVKDFRHTLIRLMSLMHGSALEEISQSDNDPKGYPVLDLGGLDLPALKWLKDCKFDKDLKFNRVEVIIHMIQNLIVENQANNVLKIPPPILSRVFQTISRGQVNLANCKKITYTLFPFPYAQLIAFCLIIFSIGTPNVMASIVPHYHWAFLFTVAPVFALVALNRVAAELEMPFGQDPNDLPLRDFQDHMNNSMLMLIRDESDLTPHITELMAPDFYAIKKDLVDESISTKRPKDIIDELEVKSDRTLMNLNVVPKPKEPKKGGQAPEDKAPEIPAAEFIAAGKSPQPEVPLPQPAVASPAKPGDGSPAPPMSPVEVQMQNKLELLSTKFDELMANASGLSSQLMQSMNTFQELRKHTGVFSSQLGQSSDVIMEFTKKTNSLAAQSSERPGSSEVAVVVSPYVAAGMARPQGDRSANAHFAM